MSKKYNIVVVGIGAVGGEMVKILDQRNFPIDQLKILARSSREEEIGGRTYQVTAAAEEELGGADFVFFGRDGRSIRRLGYISPRGEKGGSRLDRQWRGFSDGPGSSAGDPGSQPGRHQQA